MGLTVGLAVAVAGLFGAMYLLRRQWRYEKYRDAELMEEAGDAQRQAAGDEGGPAGEAAAGKALAAKRAAFTGGKPAAAAAPGGSGSGAEKRLGHLQQPPSQHQQQHGGEQQQHPRQQQQQWEQQDEGWQRSQVHQQQQGDQLGQGSFVSDRYAGPGGGGGPYAAYGGRLPSRLAGEVQTGEQRWTAATLSEACKLAANCWQARRAVVSCMPSQSQLPCVVDAQPLVRGVCDF